MAAGVVPLAEQYDALNSWITTPGYLTPGVGGPKIHLFSNNIVPNENSILTDFTEATFVGYAAVVVTSWSGPFRDPTTGQYFIEAVPTALFTAGAVTGPETIYGWFITNAAGKLVASGRLDAPKVIATPLDTVKLDSEWWNPEATLPDPLEP